MSVFPPRQQHILNMTKDRHMWRAKVSVLCIAHITMENQSINIYEGFQCDQETAAAAINFEDANNSVNHEHRVRCMQDSFYCLPGELDGS